MLAGVSGTSPASLAREARMFTYVILFLILAVVTGVATISMESRVPTVLFGVSLALFIGAGFAYMRERYRSSRS